MASSSARVTQSASRYSRSSGASRRGVERIRVFPTHSSTPDRRARARRVSVLSQFASPRVPSSESTGRADGAPPGTGSAMIGAVARAGDSRRRGEERHMIEVGIVGMGVIGTHVAKAIDNGIPGVKLAGVNVRSKASAGAFQTFALAELIERANLIVEAATQHALREFGPAVLEAGRHLMVLSVGALVGVLGEWAKLAEQHGCRILVPSGAIAGLDAVKGAREGGIA